MDANAKRSSSKFWWKIFHVAHFCISIGLVITVAHDKIVQLKQTADMTAEKFHKNHGLREASKQHFIVKRDAKLTDKLDAKVDKQSRKRSTESSNVTLAESKELLACMDLLQRYVTNVTSDVSSKSGTVCGKIKGPKGDRGEPGKPGPRGCPGDRIAAPVIITSPQRLVFAERQNVTLVCNATANPHSKITWYRRGVTLSNNSNRYDVKTRIIPQAQSVDRRTNCSAASHPVTQSSLLIENVRGSDRGKYMCKAVNVMGESTHDFKLKVQEYVKFITKPTHTTAVEGSNAILKCRATGVPQPLITWQRKDGHPMTVQHKIVIGDLHFNRIVKQDEGVYECIGSNVLGSRTAEAKITVNVFPKISYFTKDSVVINESQTLHLLCSATGFPTPVISWRRATDLLPKSRSSYNSQKLMVTNVTYDDGGEYVCTARNILGSESKRIKVIVQVSPKILQRPLFTEFGFVGHNKTLVFKAVAFPSATIVWKRNDKVLKKSSQRNYSNLTLQTLSYKDSGMYQVTAWNDLGKVSVTTFLAVRDPAAPIITSSEFRNITIAIDGRKQSVVQTCTAFGIPKPQITWIFKGSVIASKIGDSLTLNITKLDISSQLQLKGLYTCKATNRFGTAKMQLWLDTRIKKSLIFTASGSGRFGKIITFPIMSSGLYRIQAKGASGGTHTFNYRQTRGTYRGGRGALINGRFRLTVGTTLNIVVGQRGGDSVEVRGGQVTTKTAAQLNKSIEDFAGTGGGGGSFVYTTANKLLVAAGGGGGASAGYNGVDGQKGINGTASTGSYNYYYSRAGGINGKPGVCSSAWNLAYHHGGLGAGWLGQGCPRKGKEHGDRGGSRDQGWVGGQAGEMNSGYNGGPPPGAVGGFGGGGGGAEDNGASGGGGGYSGGGSGIMYQQAGGGGGSYCGELRTCWGITGYSVGNDGFVEIEFLRN